MRENFITVVLNSLVTEQAAKAGNRGTTTGDIQGRDESPICQRWFRCNQTCHDVQQWPGWCTRGLFSPKWAYDLSFVPNSVHGTVCVNVCSWCLMFLCTSAAQMSPGWYCQLVQHCLFSFLLAGLLFLGLFLLHFCIYCFFADFFLWPLGYFSFMVMYMCLRVYIFIYTYRYNTYIYNYMPLSMFPAFIFLLLSVLGCESSKWRSASSRSIFLLWLELLRITQFLFESFKDVPLVTNYVDRHLAPNTGWNMSNCDIEVCFVSESLGIRWKCWSVWG